MNSIRFPALALSVLASAAGLFAEAGPAQRPPAAVEKNQKPPAASEAGQAQPDFEVIRLKYTAAVDCAKVITEALGADSARVRIVADPNTNSLLVASTPNQLAVVKRLVAALDVPTPASDKAGPRTDVFPLRFLKADRTLEQALRLVVHPPNGAFAFDLRTNQVVVSADPRTLDEVKELLRRLDDPVHGQPPALNREVQVRVVWLASGLPKEASNPPADLKNVVEELGKIDVKDLRLVSQSVVKTITENSFTLAGSGELNGPCNLSIEGTVSLREPDDPSVQITINATRQTRDRAGASREIPICRLATTISAPWSQSVVLGVTPSENLASVFVVQLMPTIARQRPPRGK
jgi:Bacterial type II/III secretion system short domain